MKSLSILAAAAFLALGAATPTFAVDNSISPLCDGAPEHAAYARPGGFCDAVASDKTLLPAGSPPAECGRPWASK
jgi:hypothetical protein